MRKEDDRMRSEGYRNKAVAYLNFYKFLLVAYLKLFGGYCSLSEAQPEKRELSNGLGKAKA